jgi:hypothetical protein
MGRYGAPARHGPAGAFSGAARLPSTRGGCARCKAREAAGRPVGMPRLAYRSPLARSAAPGVLAQAPPVGTTPPTSRHRERGHVDRCSGPLDPPTLRKIGRLRLRERADASQSRRHCIPVRLLHSGYSFPCGRRSAPTMPQPVWWHGQPIGAQHRLPVAGAASSQRSRSTHRKGGALISLPWSFKNSLAGTGLCRSESIMIPDGALDARLDRSKSRVREQTREELRVRPIQRLI